MNNLQAVGRAMPRLAISTGDPGGIGPEISVRAASRLLGRATCVLFGARSALSSALASVGAPTQFVSFDVLPQALQDPVSVDTLYVVDTATHDTPSSWAHEPSVEGGRAQLAALETSVAAIEQGMCDALVTAPMSKLAVTLSGHHFIGHTEYLAQRAGLAEDSVSMIFAGPRLCVALATTHVPIRALADEVTMDRVLRAGVHLSEFLRARARQSRVLRAVVCGLNPHAGEGGLLGQDEERVVEPALAKLKLREADVEWLGPIGAETAFRWAASGEVDGVVAQFHDQATIASKLLDWGHAVNVTWGLPFVRVSVDHGVAYEAAASGRADPSAMHAAAELAVGLAEGASQHG